MTSSLIAKIILRILAVAILMMLQKRNFADPPNVPGMAYKAEYLSKDGKVEYVYYDKGKYAIVDGNKSRLYEGKDPLIKWRLENEKRIARLDSDYSVKVLYSLIQKQGTKAVSRQSGIEASLLTKFAQVYKPYIPRNLDSVLWLVTPSSNEFSKNYERAGRGEIAGWTCDVYSSRREAIHDIQKIWVEPASCCVLKTLDIRTSNDPRMPPYRFEHQVSYFHPSPSFPPSRFQIPPGYTAILPRILRDLPLPKGVSRKLMTGKNDFVGIDLKYFVENWEEGQRSLIKTREIHAKFFNKQKR